MNMRSKSFEAVIKNGVIKELYANNGIQRENLADSSMRTGSVGFTLKGDNIREQRAERSLYYDRISNYDKISADANHVICCDTENSIKTIYTLTDEYFEIMSETDNAEISQFALNLDLNFLGKLNGSCRTQLLPSSPYTSADGKYTYYIMTSPCGYFLTVAAKNESDGWKLQYGEGLNFINLQMMSSFDKEFGGSGRKKITLQIFCSKSIEDVFKMLTKLYGLPVCSNVLSGGFDGKAIIRTDGEVDRVRLVSQSGKVREIPVTEKIFKIPLDEYGFTTVTPYCKGTKGFDSVVWHGGNADELFNKCTDSIKKPYHCDDNLCEGGCFLWALLLNMRKTGVLKYNNLAKSELAIVMGEDGAYVPRKTIVPYKTEKYEPYHICESGRVQEQFFGVSILLEAYLLYKDKKYLDFAVNTLDELLENFYENGMICNGNGADYTTVCVPVIPIVDMALALEDIDKTHSDKYKQAAVEIAEFLVRRSFDFPTEGYETVHPDGQFEDGSISCTALSVLYVCAHIKHDKKYIDFAGKILEFHKAWTIYTPDAKMYGSSFRWWETQWEGDGLGPAICAGHAWSIWKAEALYYYGMLANDKDALLMSYNGFITNFAKADENGNMYSCYEPDFIRGGGFSEEDKSGLAQLSDGSLIDEFTKGHSYPEHTDNSLSRYAWIRAYYTWFKEDGTTEQIF